MSNAGRQVQVSCIRFTHWAGQLIFHFHIVILIESKGSTITTSTPDTAPLPVDAATARDITGNIWLSRNDAAAYLGLSAKTLAQHLHDGPTYSKFFGSVKYRLSDLDNWARQQQVRR